MGCVHLSLLQLWCDGHLEGTQVSMDQLSSKNSCCSYYLMVFEIISLFHTLENLWYSSWRNTADTRDGVLQALLCISKTKKLNKCYPKMKLNKCKVCDMMSPICKAPLVPLHEQSGFLKWQGADMSSACTKAMVWWCVTSSSSFCTLLCPGECHWDGQGTGRCIKP